MRSMQSEKIQAKTKGDTVVKKNGTQESDKVGGTQEKKVFVVKELRHGEGHQVYFCEEMPQ